MVVVGLENGAPRAQVAQVLLHDVYVVAVGVQGRNAQLLALLAVVFVVVVSADGRDIVRAQQVDDAPGECGLARGAVADDTEQNALFVHDRKIEG